MKSFLIAILLPVCLHGCGASHKGLDTPIEFKSVRDFGESCAKVYAEVKDANPKEFAIMREMKGGSGAWDLSQPRDQVEFVTGVSYLCNAVGEALVQAASGDNIELKNYREVHAWWYKKSIDRHLDAIKIKKDMNLESWARNSENIGEVVAELKSAQRAYTVFTGKTYGPQDVDISLAGQPAKDSNAQTGQASKPIEIVPSADVQQAVAPSTQSNSHPAPLAQETESLAPVSSQQNVEQTGFCKGMDLSVLNTQIECMEIKFSDADKQLNEEYKKLMSSLGFERKLVLKTEQVGWIKEKEAKCPQAGRGKSGLSEIAAVLDCKVQMTGQRVVYLRGYK
jgi:uncharacterized protein YecT (DUF1311 family)